MNLAVKTSVVLAKYFSQISNYKALKFGGNSTSFYSPPNIGGEYGS